MGKSKCLSPTSDCHVLPSPLLAEAHMVRGEEQVGRAAKLQKADWKGANSWQQFQPRIAEDTKGSSLISEQLLRSDI